MISIIVTAWEDPKSTDKCISLFLKEELNEDFEIIAACPDDETKKVILNFRKKYPKIISYYKQQRDMPKNELMNVLMKRSKGRIVVFTDGNKFIGKNSVREIIKPFKDKKVGCTGGRVMPINDRDDMFSYWAYLLTNAANKARLKWNKKREYVEFSANLLAIRNNVIKEIPLDVAEDAIIPYLFYKKNYRLVYADKAVIKVKYPTNINDWVKQKVRSIKSHEALNKYLKKEKGIRMKTFLNEILHSYIALAFPRNIKEVYWTLLLFLVRLYIWLLALYHIKIKKDCYKATWSRSKSTLPLDR